MGDTDRVAMKLYFEKISKNEVKLGVSQRIVWPSVGWCCSVGNQVKAKMETIDNRYFLMQSNEVLGELTCC